MVTDLKDLVCIYSRNEPRVVPPVIQEAVEWIASKPEGMAILQKAKELHGKPLRIFVDDSNYLLAYFPGDHAVHVNPNLLKGTSILTVEGKHIPMTPKRFFSHEFAHAAQPDCEAPTIAYMQEIMNAEENIKQKIKIPSVPWDQYRHRLVQAKDDVLATKSIYEEAYDTHMASHTAAILESLNKQLGESEKVRHYLTHVETPAIEFENTMMRYENEPARSTDYLHSGIMDAAALKEAAINKWLWIRQARRDQRAAEAPTPPRP